MIHHLSGPSRRSCSTAPTPRARSAGSARPPQGGSPSWPRSTMARLRVSYRRLALVRLLGPCFKTGQEVATRPRTPGARLRTTCRQPAAREQGTRRATCRTTAASFREARTDSWRSVARPRRARCGLPERGHLRAAAADAEPVVACSDGALGHGDATTEAARASAACSALRRSMQRTGSVLLTVSRTLNSLSRCFQLSLTCCSLSVSRPFILGGVPAALAAFWKRPTPGRLRAAAAAHGAHTRMRPRSEGRRARRRPLNFLTPQLSTFKNVQIQRWTDPVHSPLLGESRWFRTSNSLLKFSG